MAEAVTVFSLPVVDQHYVQVLSSGSRVGHSNGVKIALQFVTRMTFAVYCVAGAIDTSQPTEPDKTLGFVVEYSVEDSSKNAAPTARRLIRIVCPGKETYCTDPDTGLPTCTTDDVCGKPAALSVSSSKSSGTTAPPAKPVAATPPNITFATPGGVTIPAGFVYDRCAAEAPIGSLCETGVATADARDGVLDRQVFICGSR